MSSVDVEASGNRSLRSMWMNSYKLMTRVERSWLPRGWTHPPTPPICWHRCAACGSRRRSSSLDSDVSLTDGGRNIKSKTVWALLRENHLTPHGTIAPASPIPHRSPLQAFPAVSSLRSEDKMSWKTVEAHLRIPAWSSAWLPGLTSRQSSLFQVRPVSLPHSLPSGPWTLVGHMRLKEWAAGSQNEVASWEEGNHSPGTLCDNLLGHLCQLSRSLIKAIEPRAKKNVCIHCTVHAFKCKTHSFIFPTWCDWWEFHIFKCFGVL